MANDTDSLNDVDVPLIQYKNAFLAYVDVLGFSDLLKKGNSVAASVYYSTLKESIPKLGEIIEKFGLFDWQIMSDSLVFAVYPNAASNASKIEALRALCGCISHLQFYLALQGLWTRGGLTCGEIAFCDDRFVVGPALVDAVQLEKSARFPRIIIGQAVLTAVNLDRKGLIAALRGSFEDSTKEITWIYDAGLCGANGWLSDELFLNFGVHTLPDLEFAEQALLKIANSIKLGLSGSPKHLEKYEWLRSYILTLQFDPPKMTKLRKILLET